MTKRPNTSTHVNVGKNAKQEKERENFMKATNIQWVVEGDENEEVNLPDEIDIPKGMEDDDDAISDYLSDTTGFLHAGFTLELDR